MVKNFLAAVSLSMLSSVVLAESNPRSAHYEVTITNLSAGQSFTPQLILTHKGLIPVFELGQPATLELEILAEGGDTAPLAEALSDEIYNATTNAQLLGPGETAIIAIQAPLRGGLLSLAAMMIPTNDNFIALQNVSLPKRGAENYLIPAYDAGTETNDQSCQNIPGPRCGGIGYSASPEEGQEGFVHIGKGFHELGEYDINGAEVLGPKEYDWRNPVAEVTVKRVQ